MKLQLLCSLAAALFAAGCLTAQDPQGAASDNDRNVLTGGPITGTTLQDLPEPVRDTLRRRAPKGEVADIDKTTHNGRVVYEITFAAPGRNPKMYVREDGKIYDADAGTR